MSDKVSDLIDQSVTNLDTALSNLIVLFDQARNDALPSSDGLYKIAHQLEETMSMLLTAAAKFEANK